MEYRVSPVYCGYCDTDLLRAPHDADCAFVKAMRAKLVAPSKEPTYA